MPMIWLEIITAFFALALAWLNSVPVRKMIYAGAKHWESSEFHQANALVKTLWAFLAVFTRWVYSGRPVRWQDAVVFVLLWLIQWLVFDPVLNLWIDKKWYYLGTTARLDRMVKNGKIKAVVVLLIIVVLNLFAL